MAAECAVAPHWAQPQRFTISSIRPVTSRATGAHLPDGIGP
jgi:hypothetical protein